MHTRVAVAQLCSRQDLDANLRTCATLAEDAKAAGAHLVAFPEMTPYLGRSAERLELMQPLDGSTVAFFQALAKRLDLGVLLGSTAETGPDPQRSYNTSVLIAPTGDLLATYRKLHLFDIHIENVVSLRESDSMAPGDALTLASWRGLGWGMTICYDLRFPELYRALRRQGADILTVPSAFTEATGRDHWEVLLRARAIENQCYVIAPNQWGHHLGARRSWGRSMIIDPWGTVLATVHDDVGLAFADIQPERIAQIRQRLPCADHARLLHHLDAPDPNP